jgi:hypothetical protein
MDGDLESESDREIFLYRKLTADFGSAERLTDDAVADHAVHASFGPSGEPVIAWLRDEAVVGRSGEPLGALRTWVPASAGVGPAFARGRVAASSDMLVVAWPGASDIEYAAAEYPAVSAFGAPRPSASPPGIETDLEIVRTAAGELVFGSLTTSVIEGTPPELAPRGTFSVSPFEGGPGGGAGEGGAAGTGGGSGAGGEDAGTGGHAGGEGSGTGGRGAGTGGSVGGGAGTRTGGRSGSAGDAGEGGSGDAGDAGAPTKQSKPKDDGGCGCRTTNTG